MVTDRESWTYRIEHSKFFTALDLNEEYFDEVFRKAEGNFNHAKFHLSVYRDKA